MEDKKGAIDASALALAGASRTEADAFVRDQRKLINLQAQFARAAALDLTPSEKSEFARQGPKP